MKPIETITDRAKRYRAQRNRPAGPRRCNFCASRQNVDVDHITGDESDGAAVDLIYLCRKCNASKAIQQARSRIGIRTRQYNPARMTYAGFQRAAAILTGRIDGDVAAATAYIRSATAEQRRQFSDRTAANPDPTFSQYAFGVSIHRRGERDEGGAIIHATPPAMRSEYARRIAEIKRGRRGEIPF